MDFLDKFLDKSIYFSFDSTGFNRHQKSFTSFKFDPLLSENEQTYTLVTGASRGIGKSVLDTLHENNIKALGISRSGSDIDLDLTNWEDIKKIVCGQHLKDKKIAALVLNAGAMPEKFIANKQGHESQFSSQLAGHFYLTMLLHQSGHLLKGAKIIFVSSGGMLLKKLNLNELFVKNASNYDKMTVYANVKRAQVILSEEMSRKFPQYFWASMHPGWVETKAVLESLPKFYNFMKNKLRSESQGADTINWLLGDEKLQGGKFWFDRKIQNQYPLAILKEGNHDREKLVTMLQSLFPDI